MTLACALRELHETAAENTKLRKQISDLMVENQQQVSSAGNIGVWKLQVIQIAAKWLTLLVWFLI